MYLYGVVSPTSAACTMYIRDSSRTEYVSNHGSSSQASVYVGEVAAVVARSVLAQPAPPTSAVAVEEVEDGGTGAEVGEVTAMASPAQCFVKQAREKPKLRPVCNMRLKQSVLSLKQCS